MMQARRTTRIWWWLTLSLLAAIPACQQSDPGKEAFLNFLEEQISSKKELAEVLATVQDQKSMKAAMPRLKQVEEKEEQLRKRALLVPSPSAATVEASKDRIEELQRAFALVIQESQRIQDLPGGSAFLKQIATPLETGKPLPTGAGG
jgi:fumarate reductase subunit C